MNTHPFSISSCFQLQDEDLFTLDTAPTDSQAHISAAPAKRRRAKKEKRQTRAAAIIAASGANTQPFGTGPAYASKRRRVDNGSAQLAKPRCVLLLSLTCNNQDSPVGTHPVRTLLDTGNLKGTTCQSQEAVPLITHLHALRVPNAALSPQPDFSQHVAPGAEVSSQARGTQRFDATAQRRRKTSGGRQSLRQNT